MCVVFFVVCLCFFFLMLVLCFGFAFFGFFFLNWDPFTDPLYSTMNGCSGTSGNFSPLQHVGTTGDPALAA